MHATSLSRVRLPEGLRGALRQAEHFAADLTRMRDLAERRGATSPWRAALGDGSIGALALLRGAAAMRSALGTSAGLSSALRFLYHIDVWSDAIGPGLRLPHPFNIVIGDGARIGEGCTLMHNVTIQRGEGTSVGDHAVIANGATVLAGATVGSGSIVGTASLVRGSLPPDHVAVGTPARVVRPVRPGEVSS